MVQYTLNGEALTVTVDGRLLEFQRAILTFHGHGMTDVFSLKNNKTVEETLAHKRYAKLSSVVSGKFSGSMREPLGDFLLKLKRSGDPLYKCFLNPYGDGIYRKFQIKRGSLSSKKGLYCYCVRETLKIRWEKFRSVRKAHQPGLWRD